MGVYIDQVSVYCDTDGCDSKAEQELTEGVSLDEVANSLSSSWDIEMQSNGSNLVRCPACSARYWDSVALLEGESEHEAYRKHLLMGGVN